MGTSSTWAAVPGQPGSTATLAGPLLSATNSAFDSGPLSSFISVNDGATFKSTTEDPLLTLSGGSITTKGHVVRVGLASEYNESKQSVPTGSTGEVNVTLYGPLLSATDAAITATYSVLNVRDNATFTSNTTAPLIQLLGTTPCSGETLCTSTLTLGGPDPDPTSPTWKQQINGRVLDLSPGLTNALFPVSAELSGPVLSATNTSIFTTDRILGVSGQNGASATLTSHTTDPLVQLTGGQRHDVRGVLSSRIERQRDHERYQRPLPVDVLAGFGEPGDTHAQRRVAPRGGHDV